MTNDDKNLIDGNVESTFDDVEYSKVSHADAESVANDDVAQNVDGNDRCEKDNRSDRANENFEAEQSESETFAESNVGHADEHADEQPCEGDVDADENAVEVAKKSIRRKKIDKIVNIVLVALIVLLVAANLLRIFVWSEVTVQQNSMQPTYDPDDRVLVAKLRQVQTSDVVVVYKNDVDKLQAYFGSAADKSDGGKYELLIKRAVATEGDVVWTEKISYPTGERYALAINKKGHTYYEFYVFDVDPQTDNYGECADKSAGKYVLCDNLAEAKKLYGDYVVQITTDKTGTLLKNRTRDNPLEVGEGQLLLLGDNRDRSNDSRDMGLSYVSRVLGVVIRQTHDE